MSENPMIQASIESLKHTGEIVIKVIGQDLAAQHLFHPAGASQTHILWQAGHIVWAREHGLNAILAGAPEMDEQYQTLFGIRSQPHQDAMKYPMFAEILEEMRKGQERTTTLLETLVDEDLKRGLPASSPLRALYASYDAMIRGTVFHEGYHAGQIALLRRAQGLSSGLGA